MSRASCVVRRTGFVGLIVIALALPGRAFAQDTTQAVPVPLPPPVPAANNTAIRPGMSEADVRSRWGDPVLVRHSGEWSFLFYRNYDEHNVGYNDVVFLEGGRVVDAVVRGSEHIYLGNSSSPPFRTPEMTPPQGRPEGQAPGAVTGVRVTP